MQTQLVVQLFSNNPAGLTPREIAQIYEEEYTKLQNTTKPGLWDSLRPSTGWPIAAILFVLLLIRDFLKEQITKVIKLITDYIYLQLAGSRLFRTIALRRYRQALGNKYRKLHIPFRLNRPLDMSNIYVPLKVAGTTDSAQIDAYNALAEYSKQMIRGTPGAGKSMLLKSIALNYAERRLSVFSDQLTPILLELHRLNTSDLLLEQQLIAELARNEFPHAETFVFHRLEQGGLLLLLDGFDEINSSSRGPFIQQLKDFVSRYRNCRFVITCRTAVYRDEFASIVDQTLDIVEFNDQQIRRFLASWALDMHQHGRSVEQLMQTLHDRPQIKALARNPLLLTIITYLYTDTAFILPSSRAEFYRKSTDLLLDLWQDEKKLNQYKPSDKRLALQELALYIQDRTDQLQQDRRSIDYQTVLNVIRRILPDLNLSPERDTRPLLDEIVERSGLLLSIDGGERYQFAHLTLQEYFAAIKLRSDTQGLLARYRSHPDTWRETVKLWCGLSQDSTVVIQAVYLQEPVTAFECLADAQKVDPVLADNIIDAFKTKLGTDNKNDAIERAFGAVAASSGHRGATIFKFLEQTVVTASELDRRTAAANALSLSNLPEAARVLADLYVDRVEVQVPLARIGDLAVDVLISLAVAGSVQALDTLQSIGTPQAARVLIPLLWSTDGNLAFKVAWRVAALLPYPNIEDMLRNYELMEHQRRAPMLDWMWKPFNEAANSALPIIAGRTAYLLNEASLETAPKTPLMLDSRLVIPLYVLKSTNADNDKLTKYLQDCLNLKLKVDLNDRVTKIRRPTTTDWLNIFTPATYIFKGSWHFWMICIFLVIIYIAALIYLAMRFTGSGWYGAAVCLVLLPIIWLVWEVRSILLSLTLIAAGSVMIYSATSLLLIILPWNLVIVGWLAVFLFCTLLLIVGMRRERAAQNPLQGILDSPTAKLDGSTEAPDVHLRAVTS